MYRKLSFQSRYYMFSKRKCFLALSVTVSGVLFLVIGIGILRNGKERKTSLKTSGIVFPLEGDRFRNDGYLVDTVGCRMPDVDPFDQEVFSMIKNNPLMYCAEKASFMVKDSNGAISLNESILRTNLGSVFEGNQTLLRCTYQAIRRDSINESDDKVLLTPSTELKFGETIREDAIFVKCFYKQQEVSSEYMALTPLKKDVEARCEQRRKNGTRLMLNIMLIGIDSVSRLQFTRHFPKTKRFLENNRKAIELRGYNKVGDDTFPNLLAMLTGDEASLDVIRRHKRDPYDDVDLIWKRFSEKGYRTLMAEDAPSSSMFNDGKRGFRDPPADYYLRPFTLAVERSSGKKKRNRLFCLGDKLEIEVVFNYLTDFVRIMGTRPHMTFTFVSRLTRDDVNFAAYAEEPVLDLMKRLESLGSFNNSVVLFFSDHGIRFGPLRQTYIGRLEENWPVMYLLFPKWFLRKHGRMHRNLLTNRNRLTTPYDVYATLDNLLHFKDGGLRDMRLGMSLLEKIPEERTCSSAGIPYQHCTCLFLLKVNVDSNLVQIAAKILLRNVNRWLRPYSDVCASLTLSRVTGASLVSENASALLGLAESRRAIIRRLRLGADVLLTVLAEPSGALLEGAVRMRGKDERLLGEVVRTDDGLHGAGHCIYDLWLRKFCHCV